MLPAKIGVGIAGLSMLATAGIAPVVMAQSPEIQEQIAEWQTSIREAVTNGDYDSWSSIMHDRNQERFDHAESMITEENFALHQEMIEAKENGDYDRVKEILEELGMKPRHMGKHHKRMIRAEKLDEFKEVFANNDYDGWVALMEEKSEKFPGKLEINEETFNTLVEIYQLMESGDKEGAMALKESLRDK